MSIHVDASGKGSNATKPDLDWSQVRETVRLLNLAVAHIEESMSEGNDSIDVLTDSFTTMAGTIKLIEKYIKDSPELVANNLTSSIEEKCQSLNDKVNTAIIAFQFYDRLVQKLSHVSHSMETLGELIGNDERLYNPLEWTALQQKIRSRYTMESERLMFDGLMSGMSVKEALETARQHQGNTGSSDDIEFF